MATQPDPDARPGPNPTRGRVPTLTGHRAIEPLPFSPALLMRIGEVVASTALAGAAGSVELESLGLLLQEVGRITGGRVQLQPERLDLADAVHRAAAERAAGPDAASLRIRSHGTAMTVDVDPAVLGLALDLILDVACARASAVDLHAGPSDDLDPHPVVRSTSTLPDGAPDPGAALPWLLLEHLARALDWPVALQRSGRSLRLTLALPADDVAADEGVAPVRYTSPAAGYRVWVVEPRESTRIEAMALLRAAGVEALPFATVDQARGAPAEDPVDAVVVGLEVAHPDVQALLAEVRVTWPKLRVIALVDDDDAFDFSMPGSGHPARVGRHALDRTLLPALMQEVDAARGRVGDHLTPQVHSNAQAGSRERP